MIIVIDAYNLLHAMPSYKKTLTDQARIKFIKQLGQYGQSKGHKIVIVFDGGPYEWPYKERMHAVQVVYSGVNETADDYIKEYLDSNRSKDLLLVSSDTELNRFAERFSIPSIDSAAFCYVLQEEFRDSSTIGKRQAEAVKMNQNSSQDIDLLMLEASKSVSVKAEDFSSVGDRVKSKQIGKKERALLKKLHKL